MLNTIEPRRRGHRRTSGDWIKRTYRVTRDHRARIVEMARALGITIDAVGRLAVRAYARDRGTTLPGWMPIEQAEIVGYHQHVDGDHPRIWVRLSDDWMAALPGLYRGEVNSVAAVIREALLNLHDRGVDEWRAELAESAEPAET